jgi:type III secretory pathway component EscV
LKLSTPEKSEVDKRVAQELKNNQDFIYKTNQALQDLGMGLTAMANMHQREMAGCKAMHKHLEITFENLAADIAKKVDKAFNGIDEMKRIIDIFQMSSSKLVEKFESKIDKEKVDEILEDIILKQYDLDQAHQNLVGHLEAAKNILTGQIKHATDSVRKDLKSDVDIPAIINSRTAELLKPFYVDFEGLVLDMARLRKEVDYHNKKFENIYTLIKRLQEAAK